jgi:hypothetical protein
MFRDSQGVLLTSFQKFCEKGNSALYCEFLLKLRDAIRRKHPGQLAKSVLLRHNNARLNTTGEPRTEFKKYSRNFLNVGLTARIWPCPSAQLKTHLGGERFSVDEEFERRCGIG